MKTRKRKNVLKYMVVFACILLCTSFFVVPVSAADGVVTDRFKIDITSPNASDFRVFPYAGGGTDDFSMANGSSFSTAQPAEDYEEGREEIDFLFDWVDSQNGGVVSLWLGNSTFTSDPLNSDVLHTYSKNDTVWMDGSQFDASTFTDYFSLTKFRFVLREASIRDINLLNDFTIGKVVATSDIFDCRISSNTTDPIIFDDIYFTFLDSVECQSLALCLEFNGSSMSKFDLNVMFRESFFTLHYGTGTSPNYPMYPGAGGGNEVNDLGTVEDQILSDSSAGMDQGLSVMGDLNQSISNLGLGNGFLVLLTRTMNEFLEIPGFNGLIYVSLSLGLFGSLMGLAGSIISAGDRRAASAKRERNRVVREKERAYRNSPEGIAERMRASQIARRHLL